MIRKLYEHKKQFLDLEHKIYKMIKESNNTLMSGQSNENIIPSFANSVKSSLALEDKLPIFGENNDEHLNCRNIV